MPVIIEQLPDPTQLQGLFHFDVDKLGLDGLKKLDLASLTPSLSGLTGDGVLSGLSLPALPTDLTRDGFMSILNQPLAKLKSFNVETVLGDLKSGSLPVNLPAPSFNLNTTFSDITSKVLPGAPTVKAPTFNTSSPEIDLSAMIEPLNRLARAGAATPTRLLFMLMRVMQSFAATLSDKDKLIALTIRSLDEIYSQQILNLQGNLPLYALESGIDQLGKAGSPQAFTARYTRLLDTIATLRPADTDELKDVLLDGRHLLSSIQAFEQTRLTIGSLQANSTTGLDRALGHVLDLTASDKVFLQPYFDAIGDKSHTVLEAITTPVQAIGDMAGQIQQYLSDTADTAKSTAETVSTQIETNIQKVNEFLQTVQTKIEDLEKTIKAFIEKLDVGPIIDKAKYGCARVAALIEQFFTKVEDLKLQLDAAVTKLAETVDKDLTEVFQTIEQKIRTLLGQITAILNREEVKQALEQTRQGIETFKTTVEQASLKPVFDLVINQTGKLETSIKSLNVAHMSTPQKAALKVGVTVIEQVKVDEIIKPELMDAFEQIRAPLAELITLLKEKALEIETKIDEFNPGTVVNTFIIESEPYKVVMQFLDDFRPSKLLAPLKQANDQLTALVQQFNPDILINEVQKIYTKVSALLEIINPAPLNRLIGDAVDVAVSALGRIRDRELDTILDTIKQAISLESLLEKTGLKEIAQADFWDVLHNILGGGYLDEVSKAITTVEAYLERNVRMLDFSHSMPLLTNAVAEIDRQVVVDMGLLQKRAAELRTAFDRDAAVLQVLEDRRTTMLAQKPVFPEITALLQELALTHVLECKLAIAGTAAWDSDPPQQALIAVQELLRSHTDALHSLSASMFQDAALDIFQKQISTPIDALIARLKADLQPFTDALNNIQGILTTLTDLPPKIDAAVAKVLDTTRDSLKETITQTIATLETTRQAVTNTLTTIYAQVTKIVADLSPTWMLNSFAPSGGDFTGGTQEDGSTPPGMLAIARRIVNGSDSNGLRIAALLQEQLSPDQLELLKSEATETTTSLQKGNRTNVVAALNAVLRDRRLCVREHVDTLKGELATQIRELPNAVAELKRYYRCSALHRQLSDAWVAYDSGIDKPNAMIRLNRVILEAAYPDEISMSLQSLHPFIVQNVAHLYPEKTVKKVDGIYVEVVNKIKHLPDQLIRAPLDDEFNQIKAILKQNFDISGIFTVLELKLDGMDEDLEHGLDRLSLAYNHLLETFDQRLAAVA